MPLDEATQALIHDEALELPNRSARLYSRYASTAGNDSNVHWTREDETAAREDALRLAGAALSADYRDSVDLRQYAARRAAEIFEWLGAINDRPTYVLISAALYQFADLPAMAKSVLASLDEENTDAGAFRAFLSGDFLLLERRLKSNLIEYYATHNDRNFDLGRELVACLGVLVASMRYGDTRREIALEQLRDLAIVAEKSSDQLNWLLTRLFSSIAERYANAAIRHQVADLHRRLSNRGRRALEKYVRLAYSAGRALLWPSQIAGISEVVGGRSVAICTPTGSGKTTVAEVAILDALFGGELDADALGLGRLALYIVPSRALAAEVERRLSRSFADREAFPVNVVSTYGGIDAAASEDWIHSNAPTVVVCTQEKADALLRMYGLLVARRLRIIIVDEAHSVRVRQPDNLSRPLRLETLIARLRIAASRECRFIALSAVVPRGDDTLGHWASPGAPRTVRVPYQSTRQLFGRVIVAPNGDVSAIYDLMNGSLIPDETVEGARPRIRAFVPRFTYAADFREQGPEVQLRAAALWTAVHLSRTDRPGTGAVLISVGALIENYAAAYVDLLNRWDNLPSFRLEATNPEDAALFSAALAACDDYFGTGSFESRLLQMGVIIHHGRLPHVIARNFTRLIESGVVRICVATSTLNEGVNLPFESILFATLRRGRDILPIEEIRNVIGRAGRPGIAREGRALVMMATGRTFTLHARAYRSVVDGLTRAVEPPVPASAIQTLVDRIRRHFDIMVTDQTHTFDEWLEESCPNPNVVADLRARQAIEDLDAFAISILAELEMMGTFPESRVDVEERIQELWQFTYAAATDIDERYMRALVSGVESARTSIVRNRIQPLYRTSLRRNSAELLLGRLPQLRTLFQEAAGYATWDVTARIEYVRRLVEAFLDIPQFDFRAELTRRDVAWEELLRWWLGGRREPVDPRRIGQWYRKANDIFAFRLSWIVSSALVSISGDVESLDFEQLLRGTGIPLLFSWFRDMLLWGTTDPIVAAILSRNLAATRGEAANLAQRFYASHSISDESYRPSTVFEWLSTLRGEAAIVRTEDRNIDLTLVRELRGTERINVWPHLDGERGIVWRDYAGYDVALSAPQSVDVLTAEDFEYRLDTTAGNVNQTPFV